MDVHVRGVLRFSARTPRDHALRDFDRDARGFLDRTIATAIDGAPEPLLFTIEARADLPADVDPWPWLLALAQAAADGVIEYRTSLDPDVLTAIHRKADAASAKAWEWETIRWREGTPSGESAAEKIAGKRVALGVDRAAPEEAVQFHVELVSAGERPLAVVKELRTILPLDIAGARALVAELPRTLEHFVPAARAHAWREALERGGATVVLRPA